MKGYEGIAAHFSHIKRKKIYIHVLSCVGKSCLSPSVAFSVNTSGVTPDSELMGNKLWETLKVLRKYSPMI